MLPFLPEQGMKGYEEVITARKNIMATGPIYMAVALVSRPRPPAVRRLDPVIEVELFAALRASHIHEQVRLVKV